MEAYCCNGSADYYMCAFSAFVESRVLLVLFWLLLLLVEDLKNVFIGEKIAFAAGYDKSCCCGAVDYDDVYCKIDGIFEV